MPTAANARLDYEASQTFHAMAALTDSGDAATFKSGAALWSQRSGFAPVVRPNGVLTGGTIIPTAGQTNKIDVAALTCNLNGVAVPVAGTSSVAITRATGTNVIINSVTVDAAGAIAVVKGTEGATYIETRGSAGGPPLIPIDSIEIGQVRTSGSTAAAITKSEIKQARGVNMEIANYPAYKLNPLTGNVTFVSALPAIHTGNKPKAVHAEVYEPEFAEVELASAFVPPETTHSVSSIQVYGQAIGSSSSSLQQGKFDAFLEDGITDPLVKLKNEKLMFRFFSDKNRPEYLLAVGKLGLARTFPADNLIKGSFTISAEFAAKEVE